MTNARFAPLHGLPVVPVLLSTTPVALHKPRARHEQASAECLKNGGLPSAARRRALRSVSISASASFRPPLHFPRSPTTDRSRSVSNFETTNSPIAIDASRCFRSLIGKLAHHSVGRSDNAMKPLLIVWRRRARQGCYGSPRLDARASVPPSTHPLPPGTFALRFSSRETVAGQSQGSPTMGWTPDSLGLADWETSRHCGKNAGSAPPKRV